MKKSKRTARNYEMQLDEQYQNMSIEQAIDKLIYLTVASRGKHCSPVTLRKHIRAGNAGTLIRRLDPIAFNVGLGEFERGV